MIIRLDYIGNFSCTCCHRNIQFSEDLLIRFFFNFEIFRENELRAAEASRKEKEKKEAEQKQKEQKEQEEDILEQQTKLEYGNQSNGLHTINRNERETKYSKEDLNDNTKYLLPMYQESNDQFVENNHPDVRLHINNDRTCDQPLILNRLKGSTEKINFETGL